MERMSGGDPEYYSNWRHFCRGKKGDSRGKEAF